MSGKYFRLIKLIFPIYIGTKLKQYILSWDNFSKNTYVGLILKSCWYNLYINLANLFNDIFPVCKVRWIKLAFRLTKIYLVYGWATKSASVKTNKQKISAAQQGSKHANMMNGRTRQPSTAEKRKNTLADTNYFYIEEFSKFRNRAPKSWSPTPSARFTYTLITYVPGYLYLLSISSHSKW